MNTSSNTSSHSAPQSNSTTGRGSPTDQRRAAKRRQALGSRLRSFEASLPLFPEKRRAASRNPAVANTRSPAKSSGGTSTRSGGRSRGSGTRALTAGIAGTAAQLGFTGMRWSKLLSFAALAAAIYALYWMQSDASWYVMPQQTTIAGYRLVDPNTIYAAAGVDGWNSVWLDRNAVSERLIENPWITDAKVNLEAPGTVSLQVTESPVVAVWLTDSGRYWISPTGAALPFEGEIPLDMPRLVDPRHEAAVPGSTLGTQVDTQVVGSALALIGQMSGLIEVRFSQQFGLNFALPGTGLWVYWGDGSQTEDKLEAIAIGRQYVATGQLSTQVLDVRIPDRPFVK